MEADLLEQVFTAVRKHLDKDRVLEYEPLLTRIQAMHEGRGGRDSYARISYDLGGISGSRLVEDLEAVQLLMASINILDLEHRDQEVAEEVLIPFKEVLHRIYPTRMSLLGG